MLPADVDKPARVWSRAEVKALTPAEFDKHQAEIVAQTQRSPELFDKAPVQPTEPMTAAEYWADAVDRGVV